MLARAAKPKLSLSVPMTASISKGPKSPSPFVIAPSPMTPTARNTAFNQRGFATLQVPSAQSGLKKVGAKKVQFSETPSVKLVSPMPRECYGDYVKMTRDEKRWSVRS